MAKKKKKMKWQQWIAVLFMMGIGAVCGFAMIWFTEEYMAQRDMGDKLLTLALLFVGMYAAMGVQIVVHETGHLLFGLWTGYRFSSFRIGSMMWIKEDGRLVRKKFSLAGTGGQCLMAPPDLVDGKMPVALYNLGGSLLNLAFSAVCMGIYALCRPVPLLGAFFVIMALIGVGFALMNGIPMRLGTVDNDGYNALSLGRDRQAVRAFWLQMKMNDAIAHGTRPKDMPEEWFAMPEESGMKNSLVAAVAVMACSRLMDAHRFEEADAQMERLLHMESGIIGLHRVQLICERIYCELIGQGRIDVVAEMLDKEQKKMMKAMKSMPSVVRVEYALALIRDRDAARAEKQLVAFEKIARTYPYPADIESERELIAIAEQRARETTQP